MRKLPQHVQEYVSKKSQEIEFGEVTVKLADGPFIDVIVTERKRFRLTDSPVPGEIVTPTTRVLVRKKNQMHSG